MIPPLYEHQKKIINENKLKCGLFLGTGASKTRTALEMAEGDVLVICPKQQRDDKTWQRENEKWGTNKGIMVISKEDIRKNWDILPYYDTVIIDECFVKGTKVLTLDGYKNIEDINIGDELINATGFGEVYRTIRKKTNEIYTIRLENGKEMKCTSNHQFLTIDGWKKAEEINTSTLLVKSDLLYWEYENETKKVQKLWETNPKRLASWWFLRTMENLLFYTMPNGDNEKSFIERAKKTREAYLSFVFRADEEKQSDEKSNLESEGISNKQKIRYKANNSRWKWKRNAGSTKNFISCIGKRLVWGTCSSYKNKKREWLSNMLQGRYWEPIKKNSNRGGWGKSLFDFQTETRQKENSFIRTIRVESITIQKQPNTEVFNLSVGGHPSYIVNDVIVHNCHNNLGVLPAFVQKNKIQRPKTSQIFEATQKFLEKHPPKRLYLLSATPVPKPMSMWAIGILLGQKWDFRQFRDIYYQEIRMGLRRIWIARKDDETKQRLANLIQKLGYTGGLNDFFDVPEQTHITVKIDLSEEQKKAVKDITFSEADPLVRRARLRTIENGVLYGRKIDELDEKTDEMTNETKIFRSYKIDYILERALEFPKLLIFANYTAQILEIEKALKKEGYNVSTLTGQTKDRTFIKKVNDSPEPHIIIAQSSISSGYELPTFPCVIYASKSWRYVDYEQSTGRVLRANHLKKNLYIHLVVKGCDLDCHNTIMSGQDFQEKLTLNI